VDELSDEVITFLSEGTRTGMQGYVASDGRPLVAPVWFIVDRGELVLSTNKNTAKGRALARDPRVVLCVDDPHPPYSFVQVQDVASIGEDPQEVLDVATRTGARYKGAEPRSSAGATAVAVNWSSGCGRRRWSPRSTSPTDGQGSGNVTAREARSIRPPKPAPSRDTNGSARID
jgi:PPOX class probable F420-dependent enzyme